MGKDHQKLLNNLEELRKRAGLTQEELSVQAEVSRKSINAIENGVYVPSTVLALKISKTLNCKVEDLFKLPQIVRIENSPIESQVKNACKRLGLTPKFKTVFATSDSNFLSSFGLIGKGAGADLDNKDIIL